MRNPAERLLHIWKTVDPGVQILDWLEHMEEDFEELTWTGIYYDQIDPLMEIFGEENVLVLNMEDLFSPTTRKFTVEKVFDFIGLNEKQRREEEFNFLLEKHFNGKWLLNIQQQLVKEVQDDLTYWNILYAEMNSLLFGLLKEDWAWPNFDSWKIY